jgi:putative component of membrane protein insertase Oxa1/YidC/SpoIIIJ protein YidD
MKPIFLFFFIGTTILSAQSDWVKWESKQVSYELPVHQHHDYRIDNSNFGLTILSAARNLYYFFISDLDGDNCAFSPSCSAFFLQAIKETSIFKGTLMFADRFTRDMNFFKGSNHYQLFSANKFFDPVCNYTLHSASIKL